MTIVKAEIIRKPLMSGHCATHVGRDDLSEMQSASHERCVRNGGGNRANPLKEFQPCPCPHHYNRDEQGEPAVLYECDGCGREIVEAWYWPADENGDVRYTHIDGTGRATGEDCANTSKPKEDEPPAEKDCRRCGAAYRGEGRGRLCPACVRDDEREAAAKAKAEAEDFDSIMAEFEDDDDDDVLDEFADLDDL